MKLILENADLIRFWSKVKKTPECWFWTGSVNKDGYGQFSIGDARYLAHRLSYYIHIGNIENELCILHQCDVRNCVNPNHLFLGTRNDNVQDMCSKNRHVFGDYHPNSTLTENKVRELLIDIYNHKYQTIKQIADYYNVGKEVIHGILNGKTWCHITSQLQVPLSDIKNMVKSTRLGTLNPRCKLTEKEVLEIRRLIEIEKIPCTQLAKMFNVGNTQIYNIRDRITWAHI